MPFFSGHAGGVPSVPTTWKGMRVGDEPLRVWVDQDRCTGDGLCAQYAPDVFEFDIDGLAYVKDADGTLLTAATSRADVPQRLRLDVIDAAMECPGDCIHVERDRDGVEVAGPLASSPLVS